MSEHDGSRRSGRLTIVAGLVLFIAGIAWLAIRYDTYSVRTAVMGPAFDRGETALVDPSVVAADVHRGDVVTLDSGAWSDEEPGNEYILRVVAIGGDRVSCCDGQGRLMINNEPADEHYAAGATGNLAEFVVPPGRLFLLADRRDVGRDSRAHSSSQFGTVEAAQARSRAVAVLLPMPGLDGGWGAHLIGFAAVLLGLALLLVGLGPLLLRAARSVLSRSSRAKPAPRW